MSRIAKKKEILEAIRPLRQQIQDSLTWEGSYQRPNPVAFGDVELSAYVIERRGVRVPYVITYKAKRGQQTIVELSGAESFAGVLSRFTPPVVL